MRTRVRQAIYVFPFWVANTMSFLKKLEEIGRSLEGGLDEMTKVKKYREYLQRETVDKDLQKGIKDIGQEVSKIGNTNSGNSKSNLPNEHQ